MEGEFGVPIKGVATDGQERDAVVGGVEDENEALVYLCVMRVLGKRGRERCMNFLN